MIDSKGIVSRIILSLGVFATLYAGFSSIDYLSQYLHLSDEISSYNGLVHAAETGVPLKAPHPESVMFDPEEDYSVYFSHRFISYFNVPAYFVLEALDLSIEDWYGAWPFILSLIIILGFIWIKPKSPNAEEILVLFVPTILSSWSLASLHFVRYYGYMYVFTIICSYAAYKFYYSKKPFLWRIIGVVLILTLPGLFHQTLFILLAFGLLAIVVDFFVSGVHKEYKRSNLVLGASGIIALLITAIFIPALRLNVALNRFLQEWDPSTFSQAIGNYMEVNNPSGAGFFLVNLILLVFGTFLSFRGSDFYRRFFRLSAGFFLFGLIVYSMVMGGAFNPPFGFNRYYLTIHISYLISAGLFVIMVLDELKRFVKLPMKATNILLIACMIFYLSVGNVFGAFSLDDQNFSLIPRYEVGLTDMLDKEYRKTVKKDQQLVFITGQVGLIQHYFPQVPAYRLGPYTTLDELEEISKAYPNKSDIIYFLMVKSRAQQRVVVFMTSILPEFDGEMKIKGDQLQKAFREIAPTVRAQIPEAEFID